MQGSQGIFRPTDHCKAKQTITSVARSSCGGAGQGQKGVERCTCRPPPPPSWRTHWRRASSTRAAQYHGPSRCLTCHFPALPPELRWVFNLFFIVRNYCFKKWNLNFGVRFWFGTLWVNRPRFLAGLELSSPWKQKLLVAPTESSCLEIKQFLLAKCKKMKMSQG